MTALRVCRSCGLINASHHAFCSLCSCETRVLESAPNLPVEASTVSRVPGAMPVLLALIVVVLAMMAMRTCDVERDEHETLGIGATP